jgi:hypothetical protein
LFGFGDGVADDDVIDAFGIERGHGGQEAFDDIDGQIVWAIETEFPSFRFADRGTVAGDYIGVLHTILF